MTHDEHPDGASGVQVAVASLVSGEVRLKHRLGHRRQLSQGVAFDASAVLLAAKSELSRCGCAMMTHDER